ncbi:phosphotransferase enzyme family protein [Lederbergia graminis]|uniref:Phosphotransferase enzyme family protein n=1 Tax=Lederbergia graminis TaxID=735518 RepID=A0ABW0LEK7_9BACI
MKTTNLIIEETTLESSLSNFYYLKEPIRCTFIRRSFNDHYIVESNNEKYILRVYINNKSYIHNINDIHFELSFLEYLHGKNIPVIPPIKSKTNQTLCALQVDKGYRYIALFPFAKGAPIDHNLDSKQSNSLGEILAKLHLSSNDFNSVNTRYHLDIQTLIEEPLQKIGSYSSLYGFGNLSFFHNKARLLIESIRNIPKDTETYGLVHGDPNPSNFFFSDKEGFSVFDFDHCAFGFRIHDLAVIKLSFQEEVYDEVLKGYEQIRPLKSVERDWIKSYSDILLIKKFSDIYDMLEITDAAESEKYRITENAFNTLKMIEVEGAGG